MSNSDTTYESQTIRLNCWILGEPLHQTFSVEIAWTAKVCELKEAIKDECTPSFDNIDADELTLWDVDFDIADDRLEEVLLMDDHDDDFKLGRLGLNPEKPLWPIRKLCTIFPQHPERKRVHIILQKPFINITHYNAHDSAITKLCSRNATLFKCLQVKVSQLQLWTEEDVCDNLDGGDFFNNGDSRTCPILADIEARMAQRRTYNVLAGQESQDLQFARNFGTYFEEMFVAAEASSALVRDDREFAAFCNILRGYHSDIERIQTSRSSSLIASNFTVYFILPPFFSCRRNHFEYKEKGMPWRFPIFPASHGTSESWCRFWPKSYFMVTSKSSMCPFIISEVIPHDESDRHCMLIQSIAVARAGQYLVRPGEQFFVVGIYLRENLIVERFVVAQTESKVSIAQKYFNLADKHEAVSFLREMYNLATMLEELEDKLDPKKKACLNDIASAAVDVTSLTAMARQDKSAESTLSSDCGFDKNFGIFGGDDVQAILKIIKHKVNFVPFGQPHLAVMSNVIDDSKMGYLKFVPAGQEKEIEILRYLMEIKSPQNHTIPGTRIWPIRGGNVISMPMAGTWITQLHDPTQHLMSVAKQLFEAVNFMHQYGVAHMDLKPANILMPLDGGRLSIIDFYTSVRVKGVKSMFRGTLGTSGYIAPEVATGRGEFSAVRADLWSCGKTLSEFCKCCSQSTERDMLLEIAGELMDKDPKKRPMMMDVLERINHSPLDG